VVTFREFLEKFACYDITFAIELKGPGVEEDSLNLIKEFGVMDKTVFTSFKFDYIKKIKEIDKSAKVGWLVFVDDENATEKLLSIGGDEMCPMAEKVTPELMKEWRDAGLDVRAWGVTSVALMKKMCEMGVDGMTVNFPDRLFQYMK
jgi:glycerophosphoryl diester phosphodiesterase